MSKKLPPLNWLRSFEVSARTLNFTLAAQELNLTQAAISKQIKNLEYKLGVTLFTRMPSGLELTEAGAAYLPAVHEAIARLAVATEELFDSRRNNSLKIRISLVFFIRCLAPKLVSFRQQHPEIDLNFSTTIWTSDRELDNDFDLEIRYGHGRWSSLSADRLSNDILVPVCSPSLLDGKLPIKDISDLAKHTLLHVVGYEEGWGHWLRYYAEKPVNTDQGLYFDTLLAALELAEKGVGIALGRSSLITNALESGRLVAPLKESLATDEAFFLVYANQPVAGSNVALFRDWLLSEVGVVMI